MDFLEKLILFVVIGLVTLVLYANHQQAKSPKLTLIKHQWECVKEESHITWQNVGKGLMPITHTECVEYKRL